MPESKSGALTSLATPQLSCNPIPQWVFSQSGASLNQPKPWMSGLLKTICFNSAAHCSGNFRFRQNGFGKFGVFGEQTRTRPRHTNMYSMFSKPPRCPENLRIKTVNHRLQIISAKNSKLAGLAFRPDPASLSVQFSAQKVGEARKSAIVIEEVSLSNPLRKKFQQSARWHPAGATR